MSQKSTNQSTIAENTPKRTRWDVTPLVKHDLNSDNGLKRVYDQTPSRVEQTPSRFTETPLRKGETPRRWDDKTPMIGQTPSYVGATPTPSNLKTPDILNQMTPAKLQVLRWEK